jgi:nicotinate-nucleotide adenylyltransferase
LSAAERIGVFGGAFDPPHAGHLALARAALAQLDLTQLRIVPTGQAWHKARDLTEAAYRLEMCRLLFAPLADVVVDDCEIRRGGPSYTVDTLAALHAQRPGARLMLLIGQDQAAGLPQWHRADELARLAIIWVAVRPDATGQLAPLEPDLRTRFSLHTLPMAAQAVSSTDIRERIARGQATQSLLTEPLERYIEHHHLYQTP